MPMTSFYTYYPDVAQKETRTATIQGMQAVPDGQYSFIELYCDEQNCDCRRVIINVIRADTGSKRWATINYGWEPVSFYRRWMGNIDKETAKLVKGPTLDPYNTQTEYAPILLNLFEKIIEDPAYVLRLQRHYTMVKEAITLKVQNRITDKIRRGKRP